MRTLGETYREALSEGTRKEGRAYLDQLQVERPAGFAEPFTPVRRSEESQAYWVEPYFAGEDEAHDGHWMVIIVKGSTWNSDLVLQKGLLALPGPTMPKPPRAMADEGTMNGGIK
ncbi:MAG: TraV family lipoprotein [Nitrospirae bacterium]|nr:TraV family lipoprotein [Nitrospirota bacterium]